MSWNVNRSKPQGGQWFCRTWKREYDRERRKKRYHSDPEWREQVLATNRAYHREKYATDPDFRERVLARTYYDLPGIKHQERSLQRRRYQALKRMSERHSRKEMV